MSITTIENIFQVANKIYKYSQENNYDLLSEAMIKDSHRSKTDACKNQQKSAKMSSSITENLFPMRLRYTLLVTVQSSTIPVHNSYRNKRTLSCGDVKGMC